MRENLPQVIRENIFTKIKKRFLKIFKKRESIDYSTQKTLDNTEKSNKENFIESIKIENKEKFLMLQKKLKEKQLKISDLTDEELDEMIEIYKVQIEEKKQKLLEYRRKWTSNAILNTDI